MSYDTSNLFKAVQPSSLSHEMQIAEQYALPVTMANMYDPCPNYSRLAKSCF